MTVAQAQRMTDRASAQDDLAVILRASIHAAQPIPLQVFCRAYHCEK